MKTEINEMKAKLRGKPKEEIPTQYLSTGSTLLNLALTGKIAKGISCGSYVICVGGSSAGKTFLGMQTLAEAANDPAFDKHDLHYTGPERGEKKMGVEKFFGRKLASRLQVSRTCVLEDWYAETIGRFKKRPTVEVLDSMDALVPRAAVKQAESDGEKGSYGTDKARVNSQRLRVAHNHLADHGSILVIISQSRMNLGFGAQFNPETRSGGTALTFYADGEVWFKVKGKIRKTVLGKPRVVGSVLKVQVKKNRDTGNVPAVDLHHYRSVGFDDLGSCVSWLVEEGAWEGKLTQTGQLVKVSAPEFRFTGNPDKLVRKIEEAGRERELRLLVAERWNKIEMESRIERKPRYA